MKQQKNKV